jgi:decaprenyl-phosphate phosphoribosyltransferase
VTFCLASAGTYLVNDVRDVEQDRRHPEKRLRPIAAGELPIRVALVAATAAMAASLILASAVGSGLLVVIVGYLVLTTAYSLRLRRIAGLDVAAVAGCFMLRAAGGGAATGVPLSGWFLAVVALAACVVALGKRLAESARLGGDGLRTRATLGIYRPALLRVACPVIAVAAVAVYALWALGHPGRRLGIDWAVVSILPFALAMARYLHQLGRGHGESPERLAVRDPVLVLAALGWIACFAVATYLGS